MKNVFEFVNEKAKGEFYIDRQLSIELREELEKAEEELNQINTKVYKGKGLYVLAAQMLLYIPIILVLLILTWIKNDLTLIEAVKNNKILICVFILLFVICLGYFLFKSNKIKKISKSEEVEAFNEKFDTIYNKCLEEIKIPEDHINIDCLYGFDDNDHKRFDYYNQEMIVFVEDESLCFATLNDVYKIPLVEIKNVEITENKCKFINWNKPTNPKGNRYNGCKVVVENAVVYKVRVCQINIENSLGNYHVAIPEYEYNVIMGLLGKNNEQ